MTKSITQDAVARMFTESGYTLLSPYQKKSHEPLPVICPGGHTWKISRANFNAGRRCPMCTGKLITKEVATIKLKEIGFTLEGEYRAEPRKISARCSQGHLRTTTFHKFFVNGCAACASQRAAIDHEDAMSRFRAAGFKVLSDNKYKNNTTKFEAVCANGHKSSRNIKQLSGCKRCAGQIVEYAQVKSAVESAGHTLLSTAYQSAKSKIDIRCEQGHIYSVAWNAFQQGCRCSVCAGHVSHEHVERAFRLEGWQLLSKYERSHDNMAAICDKGHQVQKTWSSFRQGARCPICKGTGFEHDKPGMLYYVKFFTEFGALYKIGVTNSTPEYRFRDDKIPYRIIHTESYLFGFLAYEKEQRILAQHAAHKYTGANLLVSGNTELFTTDILNLDKAAPKQSPLPDRRSA